MCLGACGYPKALLAGIVPWKGWILLTAWDAIFIQSTVGRSKRKSSVERDKSFFKMEFLKKIVIDLDGVKSCIAKEGFGIDQWMLLKKIFQDRDQSFGVSKCFVFIWGVRFLFHYDIRVRRKKILIIKRDIADDPRTIGYQVKFKGIAERRTLIIFLSFLLISFISIYKHNNKMYKHFYYIYIN